MAGETACYDTRHSGGEVIPLHRHRRAYVSLVTRGTYLESSFDGRYRCRPGTLVLHPADHAHKDDIGEAGADVLNREQERSGCAAGISVRQVRCLKTARAVLIHEPDNISELFEDSVPLAAEKLPDWQEEVLAQLASGNRPMSEISRQAGVTPEHASRSLVRATGMPPQLLRLEAKWRRARALLAGDLPLVSVAAESGFADQSHFTRTVRRFSGLSPAALRREIKCVQD